MSAARTGAACGHRREQVHRPSQRGSVAIGIERFSTSATTFLFGVNAQGNGCGVYGESIDAESTRMPPAPVAQPGNHTGVCGRGQTFGVYGVGRERAGVWGQTEFRKAAGVVGFGRNWAVGVLGTSTATTPNAEPTHKATTIGVLGVGDGGLGCGVDGRSVTSVDISATEPQGEGEGRGTGVRGTSGSGAGVHGLSTRGGHGGVFESETGVQLRLVPRKGPTPPATAEAGDLLVLMTPLPRQGDEPPQDIAVLWFCIVGSSDDGVARSGARSFWSRSRR